MLEDKKNGYLIINTGTPDEPTIPALKRYLKEFLSDPDMLDYPSKRLPERSKNFDKLRDAAATVLRWMIVNLIVVPFRPKKIIEKYKSIWTEEGSPLLVNTVKFVEKLKKYTNGNVEIGMRYGNPSIENGIKKLRQNGTEKLFLVSMFPQYAEATSGSSFREVERVLEKENYNPDIIKIDHYFDEYFYLKSFVDSVKNSKEYQESEYLLFSFHGLPVRQLRKADPSESHCQKVENCCEKVTEYNELCYKAHSVKQIMKVSEMLNPDIPFKVCYQSTFGPEQWIQPNIVDVVEDLAKKGIKKISVACPSFTADCLETLEEIAEENNEDFEKLGGESLKLIPSLNDDEEWVRTFAEYLFEREEEQAKVHS
ncbi:MAG: ferrochelatase [Chloroflexi bacterium]|nr:ferrochelatase [Chloroflexota bacterium]|tara:strand:+ start:1821 stop:2924 length:1104 start_codon:yes stop_codon:yes gene_type:complete